VISERSDNSDIHLTRWTMAFPTRVGIPIIVIASPLLLVTEVLVLDFLKLDHDERCGLGARKLLDGGEDGGWESESANGLVVVGI
jgi:hypothetical protein